MEQIVHNATNITEFQRRVYLELLKTRMGETISYTELATRLGYQQSSAICRAIGQALKRNPWSYGWQKTSNNDCTATTIDNSLLEKCVPCHRVIRKNGTIGGYHGETTGDNISLKQALLAAEKKYKNIQTMKILFVCHGNICRSVMAEMVLKHMVKNDPRDWTIDSCATSTEEIGNDIYPPAKRCLTAHNIPFTKHAARQIARADYERFDQIICMEQYNIRNLRHVLGEDIMNRDAALPNPKIHLLLPHDVADPWYTGDFESTYQDIVEGCAKIVNHKGQ